MVISPDLSPDALRAQLGPVCVAVTAREPGELFRLAEGAVGSSRFLELRLDNLPAPEAAGLLLARFCAEHPQAAVLATCRRVEGGGGFTGTVDRQLALLAGFARAGAVLVDVELETLQAASREQLAGFGEELQSAGARLLVSSHDFEGTGDLVGTLKRLRELGAPAGPAIYKVVSTAVEMFDNCRMIRFVEEASREVPVVGICMGEAGLPSRVLALRAGALFTFAAADGGEATAAGQVAAGALLGEFRAAELTGATRVFGVAGNPVAHSLSPALHNAGFRAAGVDAVYLPLLTNSANNLIRLMRELPLAGLSVTMPWKVEVLPLLDEVDPLAAAIGAVNTVWRREDGSLVGTNTDAAAVAEPLRRRMELLGARVLLLGAGGAARAAAFALRERGAEVAIWNRTRAGAETLAAACGGSVAEMGRLGGFDAVVDAVINATPVGMTGQPDGKLPVDVDALRGTKVVFEMIYRPAETPLTRLGRALGIEVVTGLEMFLHQGVRQWELWTGREAPVDAMRAALERALANEERGK